DANRAFAALEQGCTEPHDATSLVSSNCMNDSQDQPRTTARVKATITMAEISPPCCEPEAMPMNAAANTTPVMREKRDQPCCPRQLKRRAITKQAVMRPTKPTAPVARCKRPCKLTECSSAGVPGGEPYAGCAAKMPAPTNPTPYSATIQGPHALAGP